MVASTKPMVRWVMNNNIIKAHIISKGYKNKMETEVAISICNSLMLTK